MNTLYERDVYLSPVTNYVISSYIREYDIQKANISILHKYGILSLEEYNKYFNMDNLSRNIDMGNLIKYNQEANKILRDGFIQSRRLFFEANDIQEHEVLAIKKDAIYIINKIPSYTEFDGIVFRNKNIYTSFYKLPRLELYYYLDMINKIEKLDVKGINDEVLHLHENHFLDFLRYIFETAQTQPIEEVVKIITNFYNNYINLILDVGFYREFNSMSKFAIKSKNLFSFYSDTMSNEGKKYLEIGHNRDIIRFLYSYYSNIYFSTQNKRR